MALIDELYSGPEQKAALVGLLEQEAYLIASIDRHKLSADEENRDKRVKNFLNKVCAGLQTVNVICIPCTCTLWMLCLINLIIILILYGKICLIQNITKCYSQP